MNKSLRTAHGYGIALLTLGLAACSSDEGGSNGSGSSDAGTGAASSASGGASGGGQGNGAGGRSANGSGGRAGGAGGRSGNPGGASAAGGANGTGGSSQGVPGKPGEIGGCKVFTADDAWNRDISGANADQDWTERLQRMVGDINLHPDYGNSPPEHYGLPINVVPESQPKVDVTFDWYPEESDPGPYPFPDPATALIEGGTPENCDGDCHFLVVQQGTCELFEGYACSYSDGWHCGNGARWDLTKNGYGQRPTGWTSADAAGLAITPGLVRLDEVRAGEMRHAIRFTTECTRNNYVSPATHRAVPQDCDPNDPDSPPMGLRVRLRSDYDMSGLSASAQVVAKAMQTYGMILADNGSNFFFQGEDNAGWTEDDVEPLKTIPASAFEAIVPPPLEP